MSSFDYDQVMYTIKKMPEFDNWLEGLRDRYTQIRLLRRLEKAQRGLLGDVSSVGNGVLKCGNSLVPDGGCIMSSTVRL